MRDPEVGDAVIFRSASCQDRAAIVTHVHTEGEVTLRVFRYAHGLNCDYDVRARRWNPPQLGDQPAGTWRPKGVVR